MYFRMKSLEEKVAALEQEFAAKIERENLRLPKRCKLIEIETEDTPMNEHPTTHNTAFKEVFNVFRKHNIPLHEIKKIIDEASNELDRIVMRTKFNDFTDIKDLGGMPQDK